MGDVGTNRAGVDRETGPNAKTFGLRGETISEVSGTHIDSSATLADRS
jgi:hypothetical protein